MIDHRKLIGFVVQDQDLEEALNVNNEALKEAYKEANNDFDRLKTIQEWEDIA